MNLNDKLNFDDFNRGVDSTPPPSAPTAEGRDRPNVSTSAITTRPPDANDNDYSDAAAILAALSSTDTEYANLISSTIQLIQDLQAEIDAGNISQADAEVEIANLQAQLDELVGAEGVIQLLINAIDSAAIGQFDESVSTFCDYAAPTPADPEFDPTGTGGANRAIQNRSTISGGGETSPASNPFTSTAVQDLCGKLQTLSDAYNAQQGLISAGYDTNQDNQVIASEISALLTAEYTDGYDDGYGIGYGEGEAAGIASITYTISDEEGNETTYSGQEAVTQAYNDGNLDGLLAGFLDGVASITYTDASNVTTTGQAAVTAAYDEGYSIGQDAGVASVTYTDGDGITTTGQDAVNAAADEAQDVGYSEGYSVGYGDGQTAQLATDLDALNDFLNDNSTDQTRYDTIAQVIQAIYDAALASGTTTGVSSVTYVANNGQTYTGQAAVSQATADGLEDGANSITFNSSDGVIQGQAAVNAAYDEAYQAAIDEAQLILDDVILQLNAATASNEQYGIFIQKLTSELDDLETFLTTYYGYDKNSQSQTFVIPENISNDEDYLSYFSGDGMKRFDPRRLVNMNNFINFSGKMQPRLDPVRNDDDLELELTPTAKTGLYILGGGVLAFLAFKLFKKK